jgi:hypothetical protein
MLGWGDPSIAILGGRADFSLSGVQYAAVVAGLIGELVTGWISPSCEKPEPEISNVTTPIVIVP